MQILEWDWEALIKGAVLGSLPQYFAADGEEGVAIWSVRPRYSVQDWVNGRLQHRVGK
jgi:hypothetical protein